MASIILVLGGVEDEAGKTIMSKAICKGLKRRYEVQFCKPISGHNSWYHYDHLLRCLSEKQIFSRDACEVRKTLALTTPIEVVNPIDCLFSPVRYGSSLWGSRPSQAVLERFTMLSGEGVKNIYLKLNSKDMSSTIMDPETLNPLLSSAAEIHEPDDWRAVEGTLVEGAITSCLKGLKESSDIVVVEGHDDRCPVMDDDLSLAVVVAPGHLSIYGGKEFRDGFYSVLNIRAEVSARDVLPLLTPLEIYEIRPIAVSSTEETSKFEKGISEIFSNFF